MGHSHSGHSHAHHDHHGHSHHHHHDSNLSGKRLGFSVVLNLVITIVQVIGGILANSLSLLSDAVHNLSDGIALWIAYIANKISRKDATNKMTFGYKRIEILSAFVNSLTLLFICAYLVYEAIYKFSNPETIDGSLMLIVATIGLLANLISAVLLHKDKDHNINVKAAYLHLMGDTLSSVAVIAGGVLIWLYQIYWLDPVITILICVYILYHSIDIIKESSSILMQRKPKGISIKQVSEYIMSFDKVENVHHIHIWSLGDNDSYIECHIDFNTDMKLSEVDAVRHEIVEGLEEKFHIHHTTIQTEYNCCQEKALISGH
jgi:cobalt-zinc-cadmium efflux system protein